MSIGCHKAKCQILKANEVVLVYQLAGCLVPKVAPLIGYLIVKSRKLISCLTPVGPTLLLPGQFAIQHAQPLLAAPQPARIVNQLTV